MNLKHQNKYLCPKNVHCVTAKIQIIPLFSLGSWYMCIFEKRNLWIQFIWSIPQDTDVLMFFNRCKSRQRKGCEVGERRGLAKTCWRRCKRASAKTSTKRYTCIYEGKRTGEREGWQENNFFSSLTTQIHSVFTLPAASLHKFAFTFIILTERFLIMQSPSWWLLCLVCTGLYLGPGQSANYPGYWHQFRNCYRPPCFQVYNRFNMGYLRPGKCFVSTCMQSY